MFNVDFVHASSWLQDLALEIWLVNYQPYMSWPESQIYRVRQKK